MKIEFSRYSLTPKVKLNNFSDLGKRDGILLRIEEKYFLDYHPWIEFGDISCEDLLVSLKVNDLPPQLQEMLSLDKKRKQIEYLSFLNQGDEQGVIKLKVQQPLDDLSDFICNLDNKARYRFDFNNRETTEDILNFWNSLSDETKLKIEYLEDPCANIDGSWEVLFLKGVPLACDRNPKESKYYQYEVFKPNCEVFQVNTRPQIFSSYMGHDLGRYHAYLSLCESGDLNLVHGINTPGIFEEQSELFNTHNGRTFINQIVLNALYENLKGLSWQQI